MIYSYQFGLRAEKMVMKILQEKKYEIIAHRYKTKYGEIDLIVKKNNLLHFLEVKARKNFTNFVIDERQIQRINDAILCFCAENHVENFQVGVFLVNRDSKLKYIKDIYLD